MDAVKLLGSLLSNNSTGGNILGSLLGGSQGGSARSGSGAADLLGSLLGGGSRRGGRSMGGGLAGALLGSLLGGGRQGGSGGGGLDALTSMLGGGAAPPSSQQQPQRSRADDPLSQFQSQPGGATAPPPQPEPEVQNQAEILIRAMCNAAKSDGRFDQQEQQNIIGKLGEVEQAEIDFIQNELQQPLDAQGFARSVPPELAQQAYAFSVMAIKLDEQSEARYLGELAQGLGLDASTCNQINEQLGAPKIFA